MSLEGVGLGGHDGYCGWPLLLSGEDGVVCLKAFYDSKGDLTWSFVGRGKFPGGKVGNEKKVWFRNGWRIGCRGCRQEVTREDRGNFMAFGVFKSKAVKRAPRTGTNSMCTITMAEANHGMGCGMWAAAKCMHSTVRRGRGTQFAWLMVSDAVEAHAEQMQRILKEKHLENGDVMDDFRMPWPVR
jgi:hypothetical protein